MKFAFVFPLLLACGGHAREAGDDHPIESVIYLLEELRGKVVQEGNDEEVTFLEFKKWCKDSFDTLDKAVEDSEETIATLSDTVESKKQDKAALEAHIKFLEDEITKYEAETSTAEEDRKKAHTAYEAADKDFEATIKAIDEAEKELIASKKSALVQFMRPESDRQERVLLQLLQQPLILEQLSDADRDALTAAVSAGAKKPVTEEDILAKEEYAKNNPGQSYTFKSGSIIELLQGLKVHFTNAKTEATKAETAAANEFEANNEAAKDALEAAKKAKESKTTLLGETEKDLNTAESDLQDEKDELKADKKTRDDTKTSCELKASQWQERKKLREHEIEAMEAAILILQKVSGVKTEKPDTEKLPTPPAAAVTKLFFLQLADPKMKAVTLLRQHAREMHSHQLQQFAEQLAAKLDGPFKEVNEMIEKMIFRLMAEQTSEDKHKAWCDLEVNTTQRSKANKEDKLKSLDTKIKDGKATVDELTIKIKDLDEKVVKITEFIDEATEVRKKGKEENKLAIKDAKDAQAAIAKAEAVLTTYYKESGMIEKQPWEFLQEPEPVTLPKEPATWDSSYTGVADPTKANEGVIAVLKATAADFAKMEADTTAQEISDQTQFDTDMKSAKIDKARNTKESEMKSNEKKRTQDDINAMTKQKVHVENELAAVDAYLKDLEPACIEGDSTYEDRKEARDKEIKALQESQIILKDAFKDHEHEGDEGEKKSLVQSSSAFPKIQRH